MNWIRAVRPADFWPSLRVRRPVDRSRFGAALLGLAVLLLLAVRAPTWLAGVASVTPVVSTGPGRTVLSVINVAVSFGVAAVLVAITVEGVRTRRFAVTRAVVSVVVALVAAVAVVALVGMVGGRTAVELLVGPTTDSPGLPVAAAVAAVVGADLYRSRLRVAARTLIATAVVSAAVLGSLPLPSATYAVLVGAAAGTGARVLLGVVPARPADGVIQAELRRTGWPVSRLKVASDAPGRAVYHADLVDGPPVTVTVVDHDRRGVPFARRIWRVVRLRTAAVGRPALSLRGQMERQVLAAALAQSARVVAPRSLALLAVGPALVLVQHSPEGPSLYEAPDVDAVSGYRAAAVALRRLHDAGLTHGALTVDSVVVADDGQIGFRDLASAQPASSELQRDLDLVALLVAAATQVGADPAIAIVRSGYAAPPTTDRRLAALLQPVALPAPTRRSVKGTSLLGDLRSGLTGPDLDTGGFVAPRLERMKTRTLVSIVGGAAAAYVLATQLSQISLTSALHPAHPGWLAVAALGSAVTYLGSAMAKQAFVPIALPLARTTLVQVASSFVALVTPPAVGHLGLNIRYLQQAGVPVAIASVSVGASELIVVIVTVVLLIGCAWLSGASGSQLSLLPSSTVVIVLLASATVLALIAAIPRSRRIVRLRLEPIVRRTLPQFLELAGEPRRSVTAVAGALILNGGYVLALDASLRAYAASVSLPVLVVVYLASSTIGSAVPTPGGVGAVEAALVAGLTTAGVPVAGALTGVLAFRAATFWIPAPIGWGVLIGLQRRHRV